jgi:peptide/nickel transport system ATP-binding protein
VVVVNQQGMPLQLDKATSGQIVYRGRDNETGSQGNKKIKKGNSDYFSRSLLVIKSENPIGKAIMEPMKVHGLHKDDKERKAKTIEILERVGLGAEYFNRYPHEFSGGQRQRIGIARTIALQPKLIVCDESVSALDISVQAQVLNLLNELKEFWIYLYFYFA